MARSLYCPAVLSYLLFTASNREKLGLCLLSLQHIKMWSTHFENSSGVNQDPNNLPHSRIFS